MMPEIVICNTRQKREAGLEGRASKSSWLHNCSYLLVRTGSAVSKVLLQECTGVSGTCDNLVCSCAADSYPKQSLVQRAEHTTICTSQAQVRSILPSGPAPPKPGNTHESGLQVAKLEALRRAVDHRRQWLYLAEKLKL